MLNRPPGLLPSASQQSPSTSDSTYESDFPYEQQLPTLGHKRHRWFQVFDIGVEIRSPYGVSIASPLTANSIMHVRADQKPDFWVVSTLVNTAAAKLLIWEGDDPAGPPMRLGNGGWCMIPAQGLEALVVQAIGQSIAGTIFAVAGFHSTEIGLLCGSQP